tara:strand:+ start:903 stop:1187 length:285 start_codon:yes stop_codon:yes gene_type:complete
MIRKLLTVALPFLTPFVVYLIYWWTVRRRQLMEAQGRKVAPWEDFPWTWVVTAGAVLTAMTLIATTMLTGGDPSEAYHSPRLEDGKIVPGRIGQ